MPNTPLTFLIRPDNLAEELADGRPPGTAMLGAEPSKTSAGHIFVVADPYGKANGVHCTEDEIRQFRDHLTKLLAEQPIDDEPKGRFQPGPATPEEVFSVVTPPMPTPQDPDGFADRLRAAVTHLEANRAQAAAPKRVWPRPQFRLEFKWGKVFALLGRTEGESG